MYRITPNILLFWLEDFVIRSKTSKKKQNILPVLHFLDKTQFYGDQDCIFLAEPTYIRALIPNIIDKDLSICIISAGRCDLPDSYELSKTITIIETNLQLFSLYHTLAEKISNYNEWIQGIDRALLTHASPGELLQIGSFYMEDATLSLVNTAYRLIALHYDGTPNGNAMKELSQNSYLSYKTISALRKKHSVIPNSAPDYAEYIFEERNRFMTWVISINNMVAVRFAIVLKDTEENEFIHDMGDIFVNYLQLYVQENYSANYDENTDFSTFIADMFENRLSDSAEIQERIKPLHLSSANYFRVLLLSFPFLPEHKSDRDHMLGQISDILYRNNICVYNDKVVGLISIEDRYADRETYFDRERLIEFLEKHNGHAMLSNVSNNYNSLPILYHFIRDALHIAETMDENKRFSDYEEYSMYQIIYLASLGCADYMSDDFILHLCNNEMMSLYFYDKKHGTDYRYILHTYLTHNCSVSEAARILYIHRNTMIHKIRRAEEIMHASLDDPILRERLIFSYHVMEYTADFLHNNVFFKPDSKNVTKKD